MTLIRSRRLRPDERYAGEVKVPSRWQGTNPNQTMNPNLELRVAAAHAFGGWICEYTAGGPKGSVFHVTDDNLRRTFRPIKEDEMAVKERSEFETWAEEEIRRAGLFDGDSDYAGDVGVGLMRLVQTVAGEGHSGGSAAMSAEVFGLLMARRPLTPLTDDPNEWQHIAEEVAGQDDLWQSRRRPDAFSNDGGATYYCLDDPPPSLPRRLWMRATRQLPVVTWHTAEKS